MKKIISALMALCLLTACCSVWAEEAASLGKPYINPNLCTAFPADERPGPEENYYLYANYDNFIEAAADERGLIVSQATKTIGLLTEAISTTRALPMRSFPLTLTWSTSSTAKRYHLTK